MSQTAIACAHPNLALVKYWGQRDAALNLPVNSSISINLSAATTTTKVSFVPGLLADQVSLNGEPADSRTQRRVGLHLDRVRQMAGIDLRADVSSRNDFPTAAGMASSASAYAALSLAASRAAGLDLNERQLTVLARKGSGSAARSIPDGFCVWYAGDEDAASYAESLVPCAYWDLNITSVSFGEHEKEVSSLDGHRAAYSSPYYETRMVALPRIFNEIKAALIARDFPGLGMLVEQEAVAFHAIAMTSRMNRKPWLSGIYYWLPQTMLLIQKVQMWRKSGMQVYFTLDAGPTIHLIHEPATLGDLIGELSSLKSKIHLSWLTSEPGRGAWLMDEKSGAEAPHDRSCIA